jgi:hypothetical protein
MWWPCSQYTPVRLDVGEHDVGISEPGTSLFTAVKRNISPFGGYQTKYFTFWWIPNETFHLLVDTKRNISPFGGYQTNLQTRTRRVTYDVRLWRRLDSTKFYRAVSRARSVYETDVSGITSIFIIRDDEDWDGSGNVGFIYAPYTADSPRELHESVDHFNCNQTWSPCDTSRHCS